MSGGSTPVSPVTDRFTIPMRGNEVKSYYGLHRGKTGLRSP